MKGKIVENINQNDKRNWLTMLLLFLAIAGMTITSVLLVDDTVPMWLQLVTILSSVFGIISLITLADRRWVTFVWGIVNIVLYTIFLFFTGINYSTIIINVFVYIPVYIYAFFLWKKNSENENQVKVKSMNKKSYIVIIGIGAIYCVTSSVLLFFFTNDTTPFIGSLVAAFTLGGLIMKVYAYKQQFIFQILTNFLTVAMLIVLLLSSTNDNSTLAIPQLFTHLTYLIINVWAIINWYKADGGKKIESDPFSSVLSAEKRLMNKQNKN